MVVSRYNRKTTPVATLRDDEISQEIALRKSDANLNEKHVTVTSYTWPSTPAITGRRTAPLPPNWVVPKV